MIGKGFAVERKAMAAQIVSNLLAFKSSPPGGMDDRPPLLYEGSASGCQFSFVNPWCHSNAHSYNIII